MFKLPYLTRDQLNSPDVTRLPEKILEDIQTKLKLMYEARDAFAKEALTVVDREQRGKAMEWSANMNNKIQYWYSDLVNISKSYYDYQLDSYVDGSYRQKMRNIFEPVTVPTSKMMTKDEFTAKILKSLDEEEEEELYSEEENIYQ